MHRHARITWLFIVLCLTTAGYLLYVKAVDAVILVAAFSLILIQARFWFSWLNWLPYAFFFKRLLRLLFYAWPALLLGLPRFNPSAYELLFSISVVLFLILIRIRELRITLHPRVLALFEPLSFKEKVRSFLIHIPGGAAQELFYRGILMTSLVDELGPFVIAVSTGLFMAEHYFQYGSADLFSKSDYAWQAALSIITSFLFYWTSSVTACMIVHIAYNAPRVYADLNRGSRRTFFRGVV